MSTNKCICSANTHAPLSHWTPFTKLTFKDDVIKNFEMGEPNINPRAGSLLKGVQYEYTDCIPG